MAIPEGSISLSQLASRYYLARFGETPEQARSRDHRSNAEKLKDWQQDVKPEWAQREDEIDEDLVSAFRRGELVAKYVDGDLKMILEVTPEPWIVDSFARLRLNGFKIEAPASDNRFHTSDDEDPWHTYDRKVLFVDENDINAWLARTVGSGAVRLSPPRGRPRGLIELVKAALVKHYPDGDPMDEKRDATIAILNADLGAGTVKKDTLVRAINELLEARGIPPLTRRKNA